MWLWLLGGVEVWAIEKGHQSSNSWPRDIFVWKTTDIILQWNVSYGRARGLAYIHGIPMLGNYDLLENFNSRAKANGATSLWTDRGNEHPTSNCCMQPKWTLTRHLISPTFIALKNSLFSNSFVVFCFYFYAFSKWPKLFLKLIRNIGINCKATVVGRHRDFI